jgi:E3 ubiquitin-protein ligase SHPRH
MVALMPRVNSLAVSGTPAKSQVEDLLHVLEFMQVDITANLWTRLLRPGFADLFSQLMRAHAIRTTKAEVKDELTIPSQTRYIVPIHLGAVERQVYDNSMDKALQDLGLDARGVAASEGWEVDAGLLRTLLRQLRGICTHPQVGQLQQRDKLYKPGALKTMADVLDVSRLSHLLEV